MKFKRILAPSKKILSMFYQYLISTIFKSVSSNFKIKNYLFFKLRIIHVIKSKKKLLLRIILIFFLE